MRDSALKPCGLASDAPDPAFVGEELMRDSALKLSSVAGTGVPSVVVGEELMRDSALKRSGGTQRFEPAAPRARQFGRRRRAHARQRFETILLRQ